jgi:hypothetical protein
MATIKIARLPVLVLFLLIPLLTLAQHEHSDVEITGAAVPDPIAQRLILLNLGIHYPSKATKNDLQRQHVFIQAIGLNAPDSEELRKIADQFASTFQARADQHNADVQAGIAPNVSKLVADRDTLVRAAMTQVSNALSVEGYARFMAFVRAEKDRMKTTEVEQ